MTNILYFLLSILPIASYATPFGPEFKDVSKIGHVFVDLRYASKKNFMNEDLYGEFKTALLHHVAFEKLEAASKELQKTKPGWSFLVFDALRPRSIQVKLFDRVKGTPQQKYVGNPKKGSIHNFGFAIDLSLADENGKEVDMGTPFDDFSDLAQPALEPTMLKSGKLSGAQLENRHLLRAVMKKAGFLQLPLEWWHYDALPAAEVKRKYKIIE